MSHSVPSAESQPTPAKAAALADAATICAISVLAIILSTMLHEGLGPRRRGHCHAARLGHAHLSHFSDIQVGDTMEAFVTEKVAAELTAS